MRKAWPDGNNRSSLSHHERLSAGIGPGFGCIGNGCHEPVRKGGRKPVSKEIRALIFQMPA